MLGLKEAMQYGDSVSLVPTGVSEKSSELDLMILDT